MAPPANIAEVRCFLGMVNQFAKFSPHLPKHQRLLQNFYAKTEHGRGRGSLEIAFQKIKEAICSAPTLALHDSGKPTFICADAFSFGLGDGSLF